MQAPQARRSEAQARHARAAAQPTESAARASDGAFGNRRGGFAGKRDQHRARKQEKAAAKEAKREEKRRAKEAGEPGAVRRFINAWADRLLGAAKDGGLSKQEAEYAGHRTTSGTRRAWVHSAWCSRC